MKVYQVGDLPVVEGDGFTSCRIIRHSDGMGYTITKTTVFAGDSHTWHYNAHLESCYCISGSGKLINLETDEEYSVSEGVVYVLDKHDKHSFQAFTDVVLMCVFKPALLGHEIHDEEGHYPALSPVYNVRAVPIEKVVANDYNPNKVAPPEMELLKTSIMEDGYTQPVVTVYDKENDEYIVVDGFHRYLTLKNNKEIREREHGLLPVVVLNKDKSDRMASTIRHNRARGSHNVELMSVIVQELVEMGKGDRWICKHIGMSMDELLRMKQITGVAALFENEDFSASWEAEFEEEV